jgi:asparagine synthase (glutamine-hydrolysing)
MCGIAGKIGKGVVSAPQEVESVLRALSHRGPDAQNSIQTEFGYLAHTRLSIIDTDERSNQPFTLADSPYILVFNGEVYNYLELRSGLEAEGVQFKTSSDTEVLFQLLSRDGVACLNRLNGFFSFAFLNKDTGECLLAIDRYGMKPLFYSHKNDVLLFASELRGLMKMLDADPNLDADALGHLVQYSFVPVQECVIQDGNKLLPGKYIEFKAGQIEVKTWYYGQDSKHDQGLESAMDNAVKARLVADVPLGCFLSGGLDSSIIAALACRQMQGLRTFSIGFKGSTFLDESAYAEEVAQHLGTDHQTFFLTEEEASSKLPEYLAAMDEPFADSSSFAMFLLCQKASEHVKVVLGGDGSDELFAGYNRHRAFYRWLNPGLLERGIGALGHTLSHVKTGRSGAVANKLRQIQKFSRLTKMAAVEVYDELSKFASEMELSGILKEKPVAIEFGPFSKGRELEDYLLQDQEFILPGDMLVKTDRMGMACGIEVRAPFLDHHVVEHARSLSSHQLINKSQGKICLRTTFGHLLPESVLSRPKRGFEIPLEKWISGVWRKEITHVLRVQNVDRLGLCDSRKVQELVEKTVLGKGNANLVWSLFIVHHWFENNYSPSSSNLLKAKRMV